LDVEAEGRHDEVQKRSQSWLDWTFNAEERHEKVQKGSRSMKKQKIQKISKKFKKAVDIILMW